MNSRERIQRGLDHLPVDKVPIISAPTARAESWRSATRGCFGRWVSRRPIRVFDVVQQLAVVDDDVLARFGVDTVELGRGFSRGEADWKEWILPDGTPCLVPAWVDLRKEGEDWWLYNAEGRKAGLQKSGSLNFDQASGLMPAESPTI